MRNLEDLTAKIIYGIGLTLAFYHLYTAATIPLPAMIHRNIHLLGILLITFLVYRSGFGKPASEKKGGVRFSDLLLLVLGLVSYGYIFVQYEQIARRVGTFTTTDIVMGVIATVVLLEATRRAMGKGMPIIALAFIAYAFWGNVLPGRFGHIGYGLDRVMGIGYLSMEGIFGTPLGVSASFVVLFIILGTVYNAIGGGEFFIQLAMSVFGHVKGGPAKIAVVSSCLFGTISGSGVSNVVGSGTFTIPLMKRNGYSPPYAASIEALSSAGGQVMPPVMGAAAFVMAEMLGIPYWDIVVAAFIPAILMYISLFYIVHLRAVRENLSTLSRSELPSFVSVLIKGWPFILPPGIMMYILSTGGTPAKASFYAIVTALIIGLVKSPTLVTVKKLLYSLQEGIVKSVAVALPCAVAGLIVGMFSLTGLGLKLSSILILLAGGSSIMLLTLSMIACLILGMGVTTTAAYIMVAILVAPALVEVGIPLLAAHLFVFHMAAKSTITPPVALTTYAGASIAGSEPTSTGWLAFRLGIPTFIIPFIFAYNQELLLMGNPVDIIVAVVTATIGTCLAAASVEGYFAKEMASYERIVLMAGAILFITPGAHTDLPGLAIAIAVYLFNRRGAKSRLAA